jgi:hypothetical protein
MNFPITEDNLVSSNVLGTLTEYCSINKNIDFDHTNTKLHNFDKFCEVFKNSKENRIVICTD